MPSTFPLRQIVGLCTEDIKIDVLHAGVLPQAPLKVKDCPPATDAQEALNRPCAGLYDRSGSVQGDASCPIPASGLIQDFAQSWGTMQCVICLAACTL
jgi:hypothetical protein